MAPTTSSGKSQQAGLIIQDAFEKLQRDVSATSLKDAHDFQASKLEDIWIAARELERRLAERQCSRNMRRLKPFLDGIERYSKAVEVVCNGTPWLPWIWGPVKLILQLASDYTRAFDTLIESYGKIGRLLPRLDRVNTAFKHNSEIQQILAMIYADIVAFHGQAYKYVRRPGWKCFFTSCWALFDTKFNTILQNLAKHTELLDQETIAIDIVEAKEWRSRAQEDSERKGRELDAFQQAKVQSWLKASDDQQEDELQTQLDHCHPNTCNWLTRNSKIKSWMSRSTSKPVLWIKGKPGSGKTVLCATMIKFLQLDSNTTVLYYFCNSYRSSGTNSILEVLRSFCSQLIQSGPELSTYIFEEFVGKGQTTSVQTLSKVLPDLLSGFENVKIIVDGLDEWDVSTTKRLIKCLTSLSGTESCKTDCRLFFSSRDVPAVQRSLTRNAVISLTEENSAIQAAIQLYIRAGIAGIQESLGQATTTAAMQEVESTLIAKSDNMFLWVRLVLSALEDANNIQELQHAVNTLPKGLENLYNTIIAQMKQRYNVETFGKVLRVFSWLSFAKRSMKRHELEWASVLHIGNTVLSSETRPFGNAIDFCKPLVEEGPNGSVSFIHSSVQEYILDVKTGPLLSYNIAQHDIALACVSYMNNSSDLLILEPDGSTQLLRLVEGFHSLHPYVNCYWLEHVLDCFNHDRQRGDPQQEVFLGELDKFCSIYGPAWDSMCDNATTSGYSSPQTSIIEIRLERLRNLDRVYALLSTVYTYQKQSAAIVGAVETSLQPKMQPFVSMQSNYLKLLQSALRLDSLPPINATSLSQFKTTFGMSAYMCEYFGCARSSDGFDSVDKLKKHHHLHGPNFSCKHIECPYSLGFATASGLRKHERDYHPAQNYSAPSRPLRRVRRKGNLIKQDVDVDAQKLREKTLELMTSATKGFLRQANDWYQSLPLDKSEELCRNSGVSPAYFWFHKKASQEVNWKSLKHPLLVESEMFKMLSMVVLRRTFELIDIATPQEKYEAEAIYTYLTPHEKHSLQLYGMSSLYFWFNKEAKKQIEGTHTAMNREQSSSSSWNSEHDGYSSASLSDPILETRGQTGNEMHAKRQITQQETPTMDPGSQWTPQLRVAQEIQQRELQHDSNSGQVELENMRQHTTRLAPRQPEKDNLKPRQIHGVQQEQNPPLKAYILQQHQRKQQEQEQELEQNRQRLQLRQHMLQAQSNQGVNLQSQVPNPVSKGLSPNFHQDPNDVSDLSPFSMADDFAAWLFNEHVYSNASTTSSDSTSTHAPVPTSSHILPESTTMIGGPDTSLREPGVPSAYTGKFITAPPLTPDQALSVINYPDSPQY